METFHRFDVSRAERAARKIAPIKNRLDATGRDQDDYTQLFMVKLWQAGESFHPSQDKENNQKAWTAAAIRNLSVSLKRELMRAPEMLRFNWETDVQLDTTFGKRAQARHYLDQVRQVVSSGDWDFLMKYLACGCCSRELWMDQSKPISRRGFLKRVEVVKQRVRKKLNQRR